MIIAAIWLLLAIGSVFLLDGSSDAGPASRIVITIGSLVTSAGSVWLIFDHSAGDVSIGDLVAIGLLATTISVYIRIIWMVNSTQEI